MRIRLVHTQALLLLSVVLLAVLAMAALSAWNLRNGFSDYLATAIWNGSSSLPRWCRAR